MCKRLSNISKRILSVVIICIITLSCIFSPYLSIKVCAYSWGDLLDDVTDLTDYYSNPDNWFEIGVDLLENLEIGVLTTVGCVSDGLHLDFVTKVCEQGLVNLGALKYDSDKQVCYIPKTLSADTLLQLRNFIEQEMKKESKNPYEIYYPSGYPSIYYGDNSATKYILPSNSALYSIARTYFDTFRSIGFGNYRYSLIDNKKFKYAYKSGGYIRLVDNDFNASDSVLTLYVRGEGKLSNVMPDYNLEEYSYENLVAFLGENNVTWSDGYEKIKTGTKSDGTPIYSCYHSGVTNDFYGQPLQVFNSLTDLYNYVSGKPTAYYTSDYYNKTYQDITLNQETINKYTTENVQNIYNTINNNVTNAVNAEELQNIIDTTLSAELDKISGSLDDVNKGLDGVNDNLQDIKEILNQILSTNEEFFQNDMEYLKTLLDALQNSGIVKVNENGDTVFDFSSIEVNINFDELFDFLLEWNIENGTGTTGGGLTDEEKNEIFFYIELYYEKLYALSDDLSGYFENVNELLTGIRNLIANQKDHDYGFYEASFTYFSKSLGFDKDIIAELQDIKKAFTDSFDTISEYLADSSAFFEDIKKLLEEMKKLLEKMNTKLLLLVGTDVADLILDLFGEEEISDQLSKISSQLTALETMKTKFPLSIPWDIANVMVLLESEPVAPKFKMDIPIDFNILGYDVGYDFVLDVDLADYEKFSELLRSFLALTFMVYLYRLTIQFKNK